MKGFHEEEDCVAERYVIKDFIGEGGMQFVYCAYDTVLCRNVALKVPKDDSAEKRFHRSAVVSAKVNHPNVAKTLDYFEVDNKAYLIEELIVGLDLDKAIISKSEYIDPFLVSKIIHHLAKGVSASHHAGVVHRDLKPTNIMIAGEFQLNSIKITDFGIAKMAEEEIADAAEGGEDTITSSKTVVGALPYMAPEAIETPRNVSVKADIWSLGAMTYELLSGKKPFGSGLKAIHKIIEADIPDFPQFVTSNPQFNALSEKLIEVVKLCLQKNPDDRPTADGLVKICGDLCYPVSERFTGNMRWHNQSWGFIEPADGSKDVFFHKNSIYGDVGNRERKRVMYSQFYGGRANRAYPVVKLKDIS